MHFSADFKWNIDVPTSECIEGKVVFTQTIRNTETYLKQTNLNHILDYYLKRNSDPPPCKYWEAYLENVHNLGTNKCLVPLDKKS